MLKTDTTILHHHGKAKEVPKHGDPKVGQIFGLDSQRVNKSNQLTIPRYTDKPIDKLYGRMDGPMDKKTWSGIELG